MFPLVAGVHVGQGPIELSHIADGLCSCAGPGADRASLLIQLSATCSYRSLWKGPMQDQYFWGCVASRESKVTAVWRRRRGITPAITWAARRHRVSKLLPDNGTTIMGPREIDFPLPGCPFFKGSLHSSTAAKRSSQGARALEILLYTIIRTEIDNQFTECRRAGSR